MACAAARHPDENVRRFTSVLMLAAFVTAGRTQ